VIFLDKIKVGIAGASGIVGERFASLLAEHPWFELCRVSSSEQGIGQNYLDYCKWHLCEKPTGLEHLVLEKTSSGTFDDVQIVFSALPADAAKILEPELARRGKIVISNTSVHRLEPSVPILVPEANAEHLAALEKQDWPGFIITGPNCSAAGLVLALKPLQKFGIKKVRVCTLQALSGAGYNGVSSVNIQGDVIPYISNEEGKIIVECKKILGSFSNNFVPACFEVETSCNRVATLEGHLEAVFLTFENEVSLEEINNSLKSFKGIAGLPNTPNQLIKITEEEDRPRPRIDNNNGNGFTVTIGRLRHGSDKKSVQFILLVNNLVRGAAGNGILIAELLRKEWFV